MLNQKTLVCVMVALTCYFLKPKSSTFENLLEGSFTDITKTETRDIHVRRNLQSEFWDESEDNGPASEPSDLNQANFKNQTDQ